MMISHFTDQLQTLVRQSETIMLFAPPEISADGLCALIAWRNELKRREKKLHIVIRGVDYERIKHFPHAQEIKGELPPRRTICKVNLDRSRVQKVSYQVIDQNLFIFLTPRSEPIKKEEFEIQIEQIEANLIITLGLTQLEQFNSAAATDYWSEKVPVVNLDTNMQNTQFGTLNLIDGHKKGLSQLSFAVFKDLGWEIDPETASLLIQGIKESSQNFVLDVNAETFESIAELMKRGGKVGLLK